MSAYVLGHIRVHKFLCATVWLKQLMLLLFFRGQSHFMHISYVVGQRCCLKR